MQRHISALFRTHLLNCELSFKFLHYIDVFYILARLFGREVTKLSFTCRWIILNTLPVRKYYSVLHLFTEVFYTILPYDYCNSEKLVCLLS